MRASQRRVCSSLNPNSQALPSLLPVLSIRDCLARIPMQKDPAYIYIYIYIYIIDFQASNSASTLRGRWEHCSDRTRLIWRKDGLCHRRGHDTVILHVQSCWSPTISSAWGNTTVSRKSWFDGDGGRFFAGSGIALRQPYCEWHQVPVNDGAVCRW